MKKFARIIKKVLFIIGIVILVVGLGVIVINIYVRGTVKDRILEPDEVEKLKGVDCILVLGASVKNNETPSLMLQDRLDRGVELYFAGCSPKMLMSGDHGSMYYNEVEVMKNYAIKAGVPAEDIFMDHAGFSTYESMYRAKNIFKAKKVIIVTQKYHLYRSIYIAKKLGLDAYGVAAEDIKYSGQAYRDLREMLAIPKDFCKAIFKPKATLMGEEIPITGDGNITNDK